jgi:hypothetical protein
MVPNVIFSGRLYCMRIPTELNNTTGWLGSSNHSQVPDKRTLDQGSILMSEGVLARRPVWVLHSWVPVSQGSRRGVLSGGPRPLIEHLTVHGI